MKKRCNSAGNRAFDDAPGRPGKADYACPGTVSKLLRQKSNLGANRALDEAAGKMAPAMGNSAEPGADALKRHTA